MGRAEALFQALRGEGSDLVDSWVQDKLSEDAFLDWKRASQDGRVFHNDDKQNLSKAISGFGNTDGGLILWGVSCAKDPKLGDVPQTKHLIENPGRFKTWLDGMTSGATIPAHAGVENLALPLPADPERGYVATLIPQSPERPLRRMQGHQYYYMRAGSDFLPIPHDLLAGMFGRAPRPKLSMTWHVHENKGKLTARSRILNVGPTLARDIYMFQVSPFMSGLTTNPETELRQEADWFESRSHQHLCLVSNVGLRLPPTDQIQAYAFHWEPGRTPPDTEMSLNFKFGCEGSPVYHCELFAPLQNMQTIWGFLPGMKDNLDDLTRYFEVRSNAASANI